ncbi:microtubule-actin cross-linking factor 1, isoforms 6/7 [Zeugodacus cucurbitae]|uniref:microtubule-actin cross-linking factor 1, isoforms 6/7 n=1 Tax=Zeugodacus cucurbitae TaxID=28588 RepID=UPI0023D91866|nr:microtubule-actin cross-linking factor 1, isoforms 6/7 [Zeugodacus cucurbitae]
MLSLGYSTFLHLLLAAALLSGVTQARQLRNNRFSARLEQQSDSTDGEVAVVEEVYPTPYPAAGYRPGRAFNLPGEDEGVADDEQTEGSGVADTTTELPADVYTTTVETVEVDTTTPYNWVPAELVNDDAAKQGRAAKAPYPPSGWRPSRAFLLPTEIKAAEEAEAAAREAEAAAQEAEAAAQEAEAAAAEGPAVPNDKDIVDAFETSTATPLAPFTTEQPTAETATEVDAVDAVVVVEETAPTAVQPSADKVPQAPYPPSGWRPSRAFLLPTEIESANQDSTISVNEPEEPVSPADKAGHPACGVSDNPVAPKPEEGAKENPDAERVFVTANLGPAVVKSPLTLPILLRSQRLITPPIYVPAGRSFAYSASVQSWR